MVTKSAKRCPKCATTKPVDQWGRNVRQSDGLSIWCLGCKGHEQRERAAHNRAIIRAAKDRPCADCGVQYNHCAMDLDHLEGTTKVLKLSSMASQATARVMTELAKVEAVCSNCHRVRTAKRAGWI